MAALQVSGTAVASSLGSASNLLFPVGGSNAWALDGRWTNSGKPMLAGDPHLQISQTPGLFLETRAQVELTIG